MMTSTERPELGLCISDAWHAAQAAWPGVSLGETHFARHVRERLPPDATPASLGGLYVVDLYLAGGCLHDVPGAVAEFERTFMAHVPRFVRRVNPSPAFADEARQLLRTKLFLARDGRPPRIAEYSGRGPLLAWLRVTAVRGALNLVRATNQARTDELEEAELVANAAEDADLEFIKQRYRDDFQQAIREAFAELPDDQRTVLRLHVTASLTTARIATMFQVNQSTVVRWIAAARGSIRAGTLARLRARLNLTLEEFESLMALMLSRLDVSLASSIVDGR